MSPKHRFLLPIFMCFCVTVLCTDSNQCRLNSKTKNVEEEKLLSRISPLFGQTFRTEKDGFNYVVAICSDVSKLSPNVSVTRSKIKNDMVVLGRRNETSLDGGDTWIRLRYECGENNSDNHSASIYVVCDPKKHDEPVSSGYKSVLYVMRLPEIKLTEIDGSHYHFVLPSLSICEHDEEVSGGTIFFIILCIAFFMYFIGGMIYRRLVHNAQGCEQLPHYHFWQKIGGILSDGCNYLCCCEDKSENSWNNFSSNLDSGDRDDALLRP